MLNLGKVVLHVLVESQLAELSERYLALRPDLSQVEDVPLELLSLLRRQGLYVDSPARVLAPLDSLEQILGSKVGVVRSHLSSLRVVERLVSLVRLQVDLDIDERTVRLRELVGVARIAVHETVGVRSSSVREEVHDLVD